MRGVPAPAQHAPAYRRRDAERCSPDSSRYHPFTDSTKPDHITPAAVLMSTGSRESASMVPVKVGVALVGAEGIEPAGSSELPAGRAQAHRELPAMATGAYRMPRRHSPPAVTRPGVSHLRLPFSTTPSRWTGMALASTATGRVGRSASSRSRIMPCASDGGSAARRS